MSERINYNNIEHNDPRFKDWERSETAGHDELAVDIDRLIPLLERHPVTKKSVIELEDQFDHDCWTDQNNVQVKPRTIIDIMLTEGAEAAKKIIRIWLVI